MTSEDGAKMTMFLTRQEVAVQLRVHVDTVDRLIRAERLLSVKIGGRRLVSRQALDEFRRRLEVDEWGRACGED